MAGSAVPVSGAEGGTAATGWKLAVRLEHNTSRNGADFGAPRDTGSRRRPNILIARSLASSYSRVPRTRQGDADRFRLSGSFVAPALAGRCEDLLKKLII